MCGTKELNGKVMKFSKGATKFVRLMEIDHKNVSNQAPIVCNFLRKVPEGLMRYLVIFLLSIKKEKNKKRKERIC